MTERAWSTNSLRIWVHFMVSSLQWLPQELQQRFQTDLWSLGSHTSTQNWVIEICLYISVSICHIEGLFCDCHGHSKMDASEWMGFLERRLELCFKRVSHFSVQNQQELFLITVRQESLLSPSSWQHPSPDCRGSWGDCWDWGGLHLSTGERASSCPQACPTCSYIPPVASMERWHLTWIK